MKLISLSSSWMFCSNTYSGAKCTCDVFSAQRRYIGYSLRNSYGALYPMVTEYLIKEVVVEIDFEHLSAMPECTFNG